MTLHLARLPIELSALSLAAGERGWTRGPRATFDEGAALHHLLGEAFGPGALQPFRLIVAPRAKSGSLYAYTDHQAETLRATAAMQGLSEAAEAALPVERLATKKLPGDWVEGRRVGFDLRLRPVVRLATPMLDPQGRGFPKGAEIDAFLAEALRNEDEEAMQAARRTRGAVYTDWLAARLEGVVALEEVRLAVFRRTRAARGGSTVEGPDATLQGTLRILDPKAFADRLKRGVGRHKAYGYGMLMLRPAGRPVPKA